ncbi:MAG TPA: carbonic anhydrase [Polyangia bacterium]|jgi:carbonic anhydrase|nr:carbonic anhydrase [Polyangia bacterium]
MQKLVEGLHRFQSELFGSHRALFERLAKEQRPEVLFITCSDSRINPNLITQTQPGDLFILRNAGNIIPPHGASTGGEAATIEFAVAGLGVRHIVVCGHSHCGAVKALLKPEETAELPALRGWLSHAEATRQIIRDNYRHLSGQALVTAAVEENVLVQIENLRTHPVVHSRLSRGKLQLYGWVYKFETGQVFQYDSQHGQFLSITDNHTAPAAIPAPLHELAVI